MAQAAQAACLSIGGLYHHFPSKRDLVLHALTPEALARLCQGFEEAYGYLAEVDRPAYLDAFHEHLVKAVTFVRLAFHAAMELSADTFLAGVEAGSSASLKEFTDALRGVAPDSPTDELETFARSLRRTCLAAILDKTCTPQDFRTELRSLTRGFLAARKRAAASRIRSALDREPPLEPSHADQVEKLGLSGAYLIG